MGSCYGLNFVREWMAFHDNWNSKSLGKVDTRYTNHVMWPSSYACAETTVQGYLIPYRVIWLRARAQWWPHRGASVTCDHLESCLFSKSSTPRWTQVVLQEIVGAIISFPCCLAYFILFRDKIGGNLIYPLSCGSLANGIGTLETHLRCGTSITCILLTTTSASNGTMLLELGHVIRAKFVCRTGLV